LLKINEINRTNQFFELRCEWIKVLERSRGANPFLTWEYLSTYWKHFGKNKKLRILYIENENEIIAIAPFKQTRYEFAHLFGYDVLSPLGYMGGDYTGLILAEREKDCLKLILDYLFEDNDWDFMYLYDFPGTSMNLELLSKIPSVIPKSELSEGRACPYLPLPNSIDTFAQGLHTSFRKNLRRGVKQLEEDWQKVEFKKYDELGSVEESMKIFFELHQKRWTQKGMPGVFSNQEVQHFWLDVAKSFADKGWLALHFLIAGGKPVGALYCYEYNQKMYAVLHGFDPDYSRYGIGNLVHQKIMEKCIMNRIKEFDFLKGDEPYKFNWTRNYRRNLNLRMVNKKFASNLFDFTIRTVKQTKTDKILGKFFNF